MNNSHTNKPITLNSLDNAKEKLQELNSEEVSLIQGGTGDADLSSFKEIPNTEEFTPPWNLDLLYCRPPLHFRL